MRLKQLLQRPAVCQEIPAIETGDTVYPGPQRLCLRIVELLLLCMDEKIELNDGPVNPPVQIHGTALGTAQPQASEDMEDTSHFTHDNTPDLRRTSSRLLPARNGSVTAWNGVKERGTSSSSV